MFIQNKYKKWYDSIIIKAQLRITNEYVEHHHIVPRSLGGSNELTNLVALTAREHFICHVLLTKFTSGADQHKMLYAANMMSQTSRSYQDRYVPTSRIYEILKKEFGRIHSTRLTGRTLTDEHKAKISKACKGRIPSQLTVEKRVAANTGKKRTPEQISNIKKGQANATKPTPEEIKRRVSLYGPKVSIALKGVPKSEEHRKKLSESLTGKYKGIPKSESCRQNMRKPKSEEHRRAISEGRKAKYAAIKASTLKQKS